ncbi:two component transcriptional regulator, LuxR family [Solimonas aquatica]|uniref:Two component transcriptional regulator, LuxR family n=1 Tax=Solimonas aquatica TaxID=489703 RepID=A0A1H8ZMV7_9GAMM|nr:response regulator [Solimonas aquatica]SEP65762.1 two component transcriptional regulator, LuxR family [Solimonas aquatica]
MSEEKVPAESQGVVYVLDDEEAICDSVELLMKSVALPTRSYQSPAHFLADWRLEWRGCLLLDVRMPGMSGLEIQRLLSERGSRLPIIFMTGHGDVPMAVEAMRVGAFDFLQKPFHDEDLIERVQRAMQQDARDAERDTQRAQIKSRYETITPREREIAQRLMSGAANKLIAYDLKLSERTVELHRAHIMQKMGVRSLAELVRMLLEVGSA